MPRLAENRIAAQYDQQATELMAQVKKLEEQGDRATSAEAKKKYRSKAQKLRKQAIQALEQANLAGMRSKVGSSRL